MLVAILEGHRFGRRTCYSPKAMLLRTLIRILRTLLGLATAIGLVFTGFDIWSEMETRCTGRLLVRRHPDWMAAAFLIPTLLALAGWFFAQQKEKAIADRLTIRRQFQIWLYHHRGLGSVVI